MKTGEYFLKNGLISAKTLEYALNYQKTHPAYLGETLLQLNFIKEIDFLHYLSKNFNVQYITSDKLEKIAIQNPSDIIPEKLALDKVIFPLKYSFNNFRLTLLTYEPQNSTLFNNLKILLNGVNAVVPVIASSAAIKALILKQYRGDVGAFDRLIRKNANENGSFPLNENMVVLDNPNEISGARIQEIVQENSEDKFQDEKRTFSMIVNKGKMMNTRIDATSITESILDAMPRWVREQSNQLIEILRIFSNLLDTTRGDAYFAHSQRVASLCKELAEAVELSEIESDNLIIAAYLHDVGKRLHVTALDLASKTNTDKLKNYSRIPTKLFANVQLSKLAFSYLENMYETYNGCGFPNGLRLNEIPVGSLILLLSHTFDVMTTIDKIPVQTAYQQLKETMFFPEKLMQALNSTQEIENYQQNDKSKQLEAIVICRSRFDLDDIAEKFKRLNIETYKARRIEKAAQIIKEHKETLNCILCDLDMPDSIITPFKFLAAIKHKKEIAEIPFYFFSQYSIDRSAKSTANALKAAGIFANYHPIEMTRKIAEELKKQFR